MTRNQLLDFLAFHGIMSTFIEEKQISYQNIPQKKFSQQNEPIPTNQPNLHQSTINSQVTTETQNWINSSLPQTGLARIAQKSWELREKNIKRALYIQERQNFIESYERRQELDRKYPITPWSAVDIATRWIRNRDSKKYHQYKQEIAQEEQRRAEQNRIMQQHLMYKILRQNKSQ